MPARRSYVLTAPAWRPGRHPDNDIVIDLPVVSRYHLALERRDGGYLLRDASTNGTWRLGQRIKELLLTDDVMLEIGSATDTGSSWPTPSAPPRVEASRAAPRRWP